MNTSKNRLVRSKNKSSKRRPASSFIKSPMSTRTTLDQTYYVVYDLETTGGNPSNNSITEIAAFKVYNGMVIDRFYSLVNPQMRIPPIVRRITGLTNAMLQDAPIIDDVIPGFYKFIENCVLVSHNATTDFQFIKHYVNKVLKKPTHNHYLCTQKLGERLFPETVSRSLQGFCQHLGLPNLEFHQAEDDARATQFLFLKILDALKKHPLKNLDELIRYQGDIGASIRLGPRFSEAKTASVPAKCGVLILKDTEKKPILVCSSHNMLTEIRKLRNLASLPKALLKILLEVSEFEHQQHPTLFSAMVEEARLNAEYKLSYFAYDWHLRAMNSLCFAKHKEGMSVKCKTPDKAVASAFVPVQDQVRLMAAIKAVIPPKRELKGKKSIIIDSASYGTLMKIFKRNLVNRLSFKHYIDLAASPAYRKIYFAYKRELRGFKLEDILSCNGFIVEKILDEHYCFIYKVVHSRITSKTKQSLRGEFTKDSIPSNMQNNFETGPNVFAWWKYRYQKQSRNRTDRVEYYFYEF